MATADEIRQASNKKAEAQIQSFLEDPLALKTLYGRFKAARELGERLGYEWLERMSKVSVISAFITTRLNQITAFGHKQMRRVLPGYKIVLADPEEPAKPWQKLLIKRIESWLSTCGDWDQVNTKGAETYIRGLTFSKFLKLITRDSLVYDQAAFEILRDRHGRPVAFLPIAGDTIRINENNDGFVQVIEEIPRVSYELDEIGWCIRNPRTDLKSLGYGYPELELMIDILTSYLFGFEYNTRMFTNGMLASAILHISGPIPERKLNEFRNELAMVMTGVDNAHRIAILADPSEKSAVKLERLDDRERDMQYREWMNFLIKLMGAIFQIDPAEIGFNYGTEGTRAPVFQSNVESRVEVGKDKGLRPLLSDIEEWINTYLIRPRWPEFRFIFSGLSDEADDKRIDRLIKELRNFSTINEVRAELDKKPIPGPVGNLILNPSVLQAAQLVMMRGEDPMEFLGLRTPGSGETGEEGAATAEEQFGKESGGVDTTPAPPATASGESGGPQQASVAGEEEDESRRLIRALIEGASAKYKWSPEFKEAVTKMVETENPAGAFSFLLRLELGQTEVPGFEGEGRTRE